MQGQTNSIPRIPGASPLIGHIARYRKDRIGLLLDVGRTQPEIAQMSLGLARRVFPVTSPALANEILVTKNSAFVKAPGLAIFLRPVLGDGLLTSEAGAHERQRRLLAPAFSPKRIASYASTMAERSERFTSHLRDGERLDLAEAMMRLTFEIVGKTLFDAEVVGDATAVGEALTTAMQIAMGQLFSVIPLPPQVPTPSNLRYRHAVERLDEVVYRIIRDRRLEGGDRGDVLSTLLDAKDDDGTPMTDQQIRDEAMTLFLAGHETTANALSWTFELLARNPDARARMEDELDRAGGTPGTPLTPADLKALPYTLAVLKEAMRIYPPAYIVGRRAIADVAIGPHVIKKGAFLIVNIIGIHRRPDIHPEPERFMPERFLDDRERQLPRGAYLPFGGGPRVCIGSHFALMEGHLILATIARAFRFNLTDGRPTELEPLVTLRPRGGIEVQVERRARQP